MDKGQSFLRDAYILKAVLWLLRNLQIKLQNLQYHRRSPCKERKNNNNGKYSIISFRERWILGN